MEQLSINNVDYYLIVVNAYAESSKYDQVPYNPTVMYKIINNYNYLSKYKLPDLNFQNLIYLTMEDQVQNGYIITDNMKNIINEYRAKNPQTHAMDTLELAVIQIAKQL